MTAGEFFHAFLDLIEATVPWIVLAIARPFGFTLLFAVFAWAKLDSAILRMAFAIGIALPLFANGVPSHGTGEVLEIPFFLTLLKEIMIGAILGFVASIPLAIALAGGGIIDLYRGSINGMADPAGGQSSTYATLFGVVTLWLFANIGGFQIITSVIYSSYEVWTVESGFPVFNPGANAILEVLERILLGAVVLAGPLVVIMFFSDMIHLVSAKFGKQINITHMAFSSKNLLAAMVLPLFLLIVVRFMKSELQSLNEIVDFVGGMFA